MQAICLDTFVTERQKEKREEKEKEKKKEKKKKEKKTLYFIHTRCF